MNKQYCEQAEVAASISAFVNQNRPPVYTLPERGENKQENDKLFQKLFKSGQELVLCGNIGLAGTVFMAQEKAQELKTHLPAHFVYSGEVLKSTLNAYPDQQILKSAGVKAVYPVWEGGLLAALNELAKESPLGFRVDYEAVPVKQVTIEFCEIFGMNPWQLLSGGCTLLVTDHGYETICALENLEIPCKVIGHMAANKDKLICHDEVRSCLNRPERDEIYKLA